jgi:translocation protein SEC66
MGDVYRVMRIREDKPAIQNLLQKGLVGDDLWNSILAAEKELEAEILDVIQEANSYVENWGSLIFQNANEIIANEKMRSIFESTQEAKDRIRMSLIEKGPTQRQHRHSPVSCFRAQVRHYFRVISSATFQTHPQVYTR